MQIKLKLVWLLVMTSPVLAVAVIFCCFYLFSSYNYLANWYLQINGNFYRHQFWTKDFFTPEVKQQGNYFCGLGLLTAAYLLYIVIKRLKNNAQTFTLFLPRKNLLPIACCLIAATVAWLWGYTLVHEGFDEVFSAVNVAALPSFQTLSYYMLPNNHVLFNLINGLLSYGGGNAVFTGKLLSLCCYWGIVIVICHWLSELIENRIIVAITTILLSLQFPIWGFSFEARGYELYSLAGWVSFYALLKYLGSKNHQWLYAYLVAIITGYFCIPTFLYFHSAIILAGLLWMLYERKIDVRFFKWQLYALAMVFLLYLPAISFSSIGSLIANPYVTPKTAGFIETLTPGVHKAQDYLSYFTSSFTKTHGITDWVLFLFPLTLFLFHKYRYALLCALFYVSMWVSCIFLVCLMKTFPLERSLSGHLSISLALAVYSVYLVLNKFFNTGKQLKVYILYGIMLIAVIATEALGDERNVDFELYNNAINIKHDFLCDAIKIIPKGTSIAFSDECFYFYYLCKQRGDKVSHAPPALEQYYVRFQKDTLPAVCSKSYLLIKTVYNKQITATAYEIYKRTQTETPHPVITKN